MQICRATRWILPEFLTLRQHRISKSIIATHVLPLSELLIINTCYDRASHRIKNIYIGQKATFHSHRFVDVSTLVDCLKPRHICIPFKVGVRHSCPSQARSKRLSSLSRSSQITPDNGYAGIICIYVLLYIVEKYYRYVKTVQKYVNMWWRLQCIIYLHVY